MKSALALFSAAAALLAFSGCETDLPPERSQVPAKLQRGVTGQGTLYQPDRTGDPVIREQSRVGY